MGDPAEDGSRVAPGQSRPRLTYAHSLPPRLRSQGDAESTVRPSLVRSLSRPQAVAKYIKRSTAQFFGIDEEEEDAQCQRWTERRKRLASKQYGHLKNEYCTSPSTPGPELVCDPLQEMQREYARQSSELTDRTTNSAGLLPHTPCRKDSVVKMTWDGLSFLALSITRHRKRERHRPYVRSRSFAPSSIADDSVFVDDNLDAPVVPLHLEQPRGLSSDALGEDVFFDKPPALLPTTTTTAVPVRFHLPRPTARSLPTDTHDGPPGGWRRPIPPPLQVPEPPPVGLHRIWRRFLDRAFDNSNRRQYGVGMVGRLFRRSLRRDRITSAVKSQLEDFDDHRPFFTYWVTTVQVLITILALAVYGFGPIGFQQTRRSGLVLVNSLSLQEVDYVEPDNFWIGPRAAVLIHLGAKFAPCMRKDRHILSAIERDREKERHTACCIRNDNSGCVQSSRSDCSETISTWRKWSNIDRGPGGRISGSVCGQDPSFCSDPPSVAPYDWPDDITKWPICKRRLQNISRATLDHMACEVIGHPCCIGVLGECRITTREYCDFVKGSFHEEASLCSQVACLDDVCGMVRFYHPEVPDQFYRLWTSLFLHAGLIHLAVTVIVQFFLMRDLEKLAGSLRIAIIYISSGIAGNLASAVFVPYRAEVGPAGSQFGLLACLLVEVIHSWQMLRQPGQALLKLQAVVFALFLMGLVPWIDNYAHAVGFVFGFLLSYALLPFVTFGKYDRQRKISLIGVCLVLVLILFCGLVVLFYVCPIYKCELCKYFNCIPLTKNLCADQDIIITRGEL